MITAMPRIAIATATEDFGRALELFGDVFAMPVADFSDSTVASLGAHVGMCQPDRGSNIELMAPATPGPLSDAIQQTIDRRGEGFYALMLEAPDPDAEAEELIRREVNVLPLMAGAGGRDIHPRSTHGVLIRVYPDGSVAQPAWSGCRASLGPWSPPVTLSRRPGPTARVSAWPWSTPSTTTSGASAQ